MVQIRQGQFFRSLASSVKNRMLMVSSRKGEKRTEQSKNSDSYEELISDVALLSCINWPANYGQKPAFGERSVKQLSERFHLDVAASVAGFKLFKAVGGQGMNHQIQPLMEAHIVIPISTAECERSFSVMNTLITAKRNKLSTHHASNLMLISIIGPPVQKFNPKPHVEAWLCQGRHAASERNTKKRHAPEELSAFLPYF